MTLYLMRHAEAVEASHAMPRDADRILTDKGRRQAKRMGLLLQRLDVKIDRVLASPFARARETAELVIAAAGLSVKIRTADALKPNSSTDAMWAAISGASAGTTLVVGHLPSMANLAGSLLACMAEPPLWFHKSSLAALHYETRPNGQIHARLEWMASPAMAKRLGAREQ